MVTKKEFFEIFKYNYVTELYNGYEVTFSDGKNFEFLFFHTYSLRQTPRNIIIKQKEMIYRRFEEKILKEYFKNIDTTNQYLLCSFFINGKYLVTPKTYLEIMHKI